MNGSSEKQCQPRLSSDAVARHADEPISPKSFALVDLDQQQLDSIFRRVPGGAANVADIYPLSPLQEGMLYHHLVDEQDTYILSTLLELDSPNELNALIEALETVIGRHDVLRTAILWEELPRPLQVVCRKATLEIEERKLDPSRDAVSQLRALMRPGSSRIDLRQAPMMKLIVAAQGTNDRRYAVLQIHHLECDHRSLGAVVAECLAYMDGKAANLPEPTPYRAYVEDALRQAGEDSGEEFFSQKLGDVVEPTVAFGIVKAHGNGATIQEAHAGVSAPLAERVRTAARRMKVSPARLFHAAWALVISQASDRDDVVYGTVVLAGQQRRSAAGYMLGMAINTLPLRLRMTGVSVKGLLDLTQHELRDLVKYEHVPLTTAQRCSGLEPSISSFNSLFNFRHSAPGSDPASTMAAGVRVLERGEAWSDYPVAVTVDDFGDRFSLIAHTDSRLSGDRILEYLSVALRALIEALIEAPDTPVHELTVVPAKERSRILEEFNATESEYPRDKLIHELFESQVRRTPDAAAVICEGNSLTYAELNAKANRLAWYLRAMGVGPDERVGICTERSLEMVVGILGILKAGGAYVPLDPDLPVDRIAYMLADAAPRVVVIQERLRTSLPSSNAKWVAIDSEWDKIGRQASTNLASARAGSLPDCLAYVIYTSGSTGRPKGVMVEHRSVVLLWDSLQSIYDQTGQCSRVALNAPFTFDASVQQFVQLLSGRTLCLVPNDTRRDPVDMLRFIDELDIEAVDCTPSQLRSWVKAGLLGKENSSLKMVLVGGEAIDSALWDVLSDSTKIQFWNVYGPTECTVDSTAAPVTRKCSEPHIGQPMRNRRVYILDHHKRIVPLGAIGEIFIGGGGVARGYLNRSGLTQERFLTDPFDVGPGKRMYRTGDLGRWRADGTIDYLGRNDQQVKLRGFRIEPGEIEAQLVQHSSIKESAVIVRKDSSGDERLVAYVTLNDPGHPPAVEVLREHLKAALPDYMVPSAFVLLEQLPLAISGKLDRSALPSPDADAYVRGRYEAPEGEVEALLARIWQELLHIERVGRNDNFFELGGHSLLIVQMLERLRRFGLSVHARCVFECPTLSAVSAAVTQDATQGIRLPNPGIPYGCEVLTPKMLALVRLDTAHIEDIVRSVPGGAKNIQDIYPLAPLQEGILFHHLLAGSDGDPYIFLVLLSFESRRQLDGFVAALQYVISCHDVLRTAVLWESLPLPVQVVYRHAALPVEEITLEKGCDAVGKLRELMTRKQQVLSLTSAPLMRLRTASDAQSGRWYAILQLHHIVCDNTSLGVIFREIVAQQYGAGAGMTDSGEYRCYMAGLLSRRESVDHERYFRSKLGDVVESTTIFDLLESDGGVDDVASAEEEVDATVARRLRAQARRLGVSAATLFHSAWALVLAHTTGRDDVVLGSVVLGRLRGNAGGLRSVGLYINTLPVRIRLNGVTAQGLVERTRREILELLDHEDATLAVAQRCSNVPQGAPLFNTLLNYRHQSIDPKSAFGSDSGVTVLETKSGTNYPILMSVDETAEGFLLTAQTDARVEPHRITGYMHEALRSLVDALEFAPDTGAMTISILSSKELREVLTVFNETEVPYSNLALVHQLFEQQVTRTPTEIAVLHDGRSLTYDEINCRANQLARCLRNYGIGPDCPVGICIERSPEMVIGLLAILKAGGAYVPLDPNYPTERLHQMLADATPSVVLTQSELVPVVPSTSAEVIVLDGRLKEMAAKVQENISVGDLGLNSRNLVYVIYTSGSTGRPKGTAMSHGAMVNLIEWHRRTFDNVPGTRVLQFAALSFDVAFQEIFTTLCSGGTLVLLDEWLRRDARALAAFLSSQRIQRLFVPPLMLQALAESTKSGGVIPESLADVITAGEQLRVSPEMAFLFGSLPGCRLHNHYGPTETHVVTALTLAGDPSSWPTLPAIGKPISNVKIYVLDSQRQPVPLGVAGEIYIAGAGVARGYLGRSDLTAQRFIEDTFTSKPGARMYRTGDLGRWQPGGTLEYLGRNDFQVKIRGHRVEPGEIEAQLARHAGVKDVAVVARIDQSGSKCLVAYIAPRNQARPRADSLRDHLKAVLPEYMVPSAFVVLDCLPVTPSGKLDRQALPDLQVDAYATQQYIGPQGEAEEALAIIWRDVLHLDRIGRYDNFFALGGHSISVMKVVMKVNELMDSSLHVKDVYQYPSLHELAGRLAGSKVSDEFVDLATEAYLEMGPCTRLN